MYNRSTMARVAEIQREISFKVAKTQDVPEELRTFDFITAQLLLQRGIATRQDAEKFLRPQLSDLSDPYLLEDLDKAVERIKQAAKQREKVVVYGDYDVDGVTSATVLISVLERMGIDVSIYLPERMKEGYGMNEAAIKKIHKQKASLIITVDNGTTNVVEVDLAKSLGIDVIIVDHHHVPEVLPKACALINPKRPDSKYPFRELAAVGVTYQLARALVGDKHAQRYLDLVVLGTVADVVPLLGENRTLTIFGLKALNETKRIGIKALVDVAGLKGKPLETYHIGFQLGPRLNAASRMEHALTSFKLLRSKDSKEAYKLAEQLDALNTRRQELTDQILESAHARADSWRGEKIIVAGEEGWSIGVVGIVASRLAEKYSKPAIVFEYQKEVCKGSARSIDGVHILELLESVRDTIHHFGGHAKAAGLTVEREKFEKFKEKLLEAAKSQIHSSLLKPSLGISVVLEPKVVAPKLLNTVVQFIPFGFGNPTPVFGVRGVKLFGYEMIGSGGSHLRLTFTDGDDNRLQVMAFDGWGMMFDLKMNQKYDAAFTISEREWQGKKFMQQKLVAMRPATPGGAA